MKTNKILVAGLSLFLSVSAFAQTSVDEIVNKHVAALGGVENLKDVKSISTDQSISVQGMDIPVKTVVLVGKAFRSESKIMGNSMISVVDGTTGWMIRPAMMGGTGEPEDMPGDQLKMSQGQLDPFGALVNYKDKGHKVEYIGKEKAGKKELHHLKLTMNNGQVVDEYLDPETYMVTKVVATANGQTSEIGLGDYKEINGVKIPHLMEMANPMAGQMSFITNKVVINGPIDESVFKKPAK